MMLRPKTAAVLEYLVARPDRLVTKSELLSAIWPRGFVGDSVLAVCVAELRHALRDDARKPRFIATAHGRGYRFVAPVSPAPTDERGQAGPRDELFVGRVAELARLEEWWRAARLGGPVVGFVAGDAGAGKTALVREFVSGLRARGDALVGVGQCVDLIGGGEPYQPLLDAFADLCRGPDGGRVRELLRDHAPSWLLQLPGLVRAEDAARMAFVLGGRPHPAASRPGREAGPGRMLREAHDVLEAIATTVRPVVLVCEDLQAGDVPSIDLLGYLARRQNAMRLLVVATYRTRAPDSAARRLRAVVEDLRGRRLARHEDLGPLSTADVAEYLSRLMEPAKPSAELATAVRRRTDGNALFVVNVVDHLLARGLLVGVGSEAAAPDGDATRFGVPETVRQLIGRQLDDLSPSDRELVEVAAVAGVEFSAAAVGAGLGGDDDHVEERLAALALTSPLVVDAGTAQWPDGTVTARSRFAHALQQEVVYAQVGPARRAKLHRQIGERLERGHGDRAGDIAAELARHFANGRDTPRAVAYLARAAETALRRQAPKEALAHVERGLAVLRDAVPAPERWGMELRLQVIRLSALIARDGFGSLGVEDTFARVRDLAEVVDDPAVLAPVRYGMWVYTLQRGAVRDAAALLPDLDRVVERAGDAGVRMQALNAHAATLLFAGAPLQARSFADGALTLDAPATRRRHVGYFQDSGVLSHTFASYALWLLGFPDRARSHAADALRRAEAIGAADGLCQVLWPVAVIHQLCGDVGAVRRLSARLLSLAIELGFPLWQGAAKVLSGWAEITSGAGGGSLDTIRAGLDEVAATGVHVSRPYHLSLLADAAATRRRPDLAHAAVADGLRLAERTGEHWVDSDLIRQRALLEADDGRTATAVDSMLEAVAVARAQRSRSLELRALTSLVRLAPGRTGARAQLESRLDTFTEGHDTADLRAAEEVLASDPVRRGEPSGG